MRQIVGLIVTFLIFVTFQAAGQLTASRYFYDDLGRLVRVVDQNGNVATYSYDAVGNITSITRSTVPANNGLAILGFSPHGGPIGQTVTIQGQGFGTTPTANTVQFNGTAATVSVATATTLTVTVPMGATTGPISLTVNGQSAQSDTAFTVTPTLTSISVSPSHPTIRSVGQQQQFTATGIYNFGSPQDLTQSVTWGSSNLNVATVSNITVSQGLVSTLQNGTANITATSGAMSGVATLAVSGPVLVNLNPSFATIFTRGTQQFTATVNFFDGTTQDITGQATWSSSDPSIVSVNNQGLAAALGPGVGRICATSGALAGCSEVSVVPNLLSIAITPTSISTPKGITQQFIATGSFDDGSSQDVTTTSIWKSSNAAVATISNSSPGLATYVGVGTTTITATSGSVSSSTTFTVTPAVPTNISIDPGKASLVPGNTFQFAAAVVSTDGTSQSGTQTSTWTSSNPNIATVNSQGLVTAVGPGYATISATSGTLSGSAAVFVSNSGGSVVRFLFETNAQGSTISRYAITPTTGTLRSSAYWLGSGSYPRAALVSPNNKFLYVVNNSSYNVSGYSIAADGSLTEINGSPFTAGTGPNAVTISPNGQFLYVTNQYDNTVSGFTVDPVSGVLVQISGSPFAVGTNPIAITLDPSGNFLYVASNRFSSVSAFTVDPTTGVLTQVPGSPFSTGPFPISLTVDSSGKYLYVANTGQTFSSKLNSVAQLSLPTIQKGDKGGFGPDPLHHFWSSVLAKTGSVNRASANMTVVPGSILHSQTNMSRFSSLPVPRYGEFLEGAGGGGATGPSISVFAIDPASGILTEISGSPFGITYTPSAITANPISQFVYVTQGGNIVSSFSINPATGMPTDVADFSYPGEFNLTTMMLDPSGQFLYVAASSDVLQFGVNTITGTLTPLGEMPARNGPSALAISTGSAPVTFTPQYAYVTNNSSTTPGASSSNSVSAFSVDPVAGSLTAVSGSPFSEGFLPEFEAADPFGRFLFITNQCSDNSCSAPIGSVSAYGISSANGSLVSATGSPFGAGLNAQGVVVDPSGRFLYEINNGDNTVNGYSIDPSSGALITLPGFPSAVNGSAPLALGIDASGTNLYVAQACVSSPCAGQGVAVYSVNSDGTISYSSSFSIGTALQAMAADPAGRFVFVTDLVTNTISVLVSSPGGNSGPPALSLLVKPITFTSSGGDPLSLGPGSPFPTGGGPVAVAVDPTGKFVYVANRFSNSVSVYMLDPNTGILTPVSGSPFATGTAPIAVNVDIPGRFVFVTNSLDNTVSVFASDPGLGTLTPVLGSPFATGATPNAVVTTGKVQ